MRTFLIALGGAFLLAGTSWGQAPLLMPEVLKTKQDKVSYSLGLSFGHDAASEMKDLAKNFKKDGIDFDSKLFLRGMIDVLTEAKTLLTEDERDTILEAFAKEMQATAPQRAAAQADRNKKDGEAFLAANGKKRDVMTTKSGLQYKVLKEGTGPQPQPSDVVKVHYTGTLIDGTVFDSSVEKKEPAVFPVKGVIPGWVEALQLMKVGSKWQIFIPSDLAYGERGPREIGPNSALIFEVELISIETPAKREPVQPRMPIDP